MSESSTPVEVPGYVLEHVIGQGATSVVWAGRDAAGEAVALKVAHRGADALDRLQSATERDVLTGLRHDHLVTLRAAIPLADGRVVSVFDRVVGASLRATVDARGHLRPGEAVTVLTPICDAVATLHRAGALHGDISPGNVLIDADGRPVLADLGAARVVGSGAAVVGTPGFIAPEVLAGDAPSEAAEVYALGALAWFCLTGSGAPDTPLRLAAEDVVRAVGPELAGCVAACIDPEPSRRPSSDRLGHDFFSAVPAEPIEVVIGADEASALTHRIRLNAAGPPAETRAARRRSVPALAALRHGMRAAGGRLSPVLLPAAFVVAALVGGSAAWSLLGTVTAKTHPQLQSASGHRTVAPSPGPPAIASSRPPQPSTSGVDVLGDPLAPRTSPGALLHVLAERRADLLVRRDRAALTGVHVARSESWAADERLLAELERGGQRYSGLGVAAVTAQPVSGDQTTAVIRGRVDLTAYVVLDGSGRSSERPAATGQELDFSLVRTPAGWRIESISASATT